MTHSSMNEPYLLCMVLLFQYAFFLVFFSSEIFATRMDQGDAFLCMRY